MRRYETGAQKGSNCRLSLRQSAAHRFLNLPSAHCAAKRKPSSVAEAHSSNFGENRKSPLLPIAIAILRRMPFDPARRTGEPLNSFSKDC